MEFLMEWVCETPGESEEQVAEAVIPALKDRILISASQNAYL